MALDQVKTELFEKALKGSPNGALYLGLAIVAFVLFFMVKKSIKNIRIERAHKKTTKQQLEDQNAVEEKNESLEEEQSDAADFIKEKLNRDVT